MTEQKRQSLIISEPPETTNLKTVETPVWEENDGIAEELELFDRTTRARRLRGRQGSGSSCSAYLLRDFPEWDETSLEIRWEAEEREFTVVFKGEGKINLSVEQLLSKKVPLYIASSSTCECGETLELGDYRINTTNNDFTFEGTFFCPRCKSRVFREGYGLRSIIGQWVRGLKKIEISPKGVGLEREGS
jgi:hypothetical protein